VGLISRRDVIKAVYQEQTAALAATSAGNQAFVSKG
jgi:hypothetical protein